jgi:hypothetical protein
VLIKNQRQQTPNGVWDVATGLHAHVGKGHDRVTSSPAFWGVADGATPLQPEWPDPGHFADAALAALSEQFASNPSVAMTEIYRRAIETVRKIYLPKRLVSCAVAVASSRQDGRLSIGVLGDCVAEVSLRSGEVAVITDSRISEIDAHADLLEGPARADRRLANRLTMNSPAGYWIFALEPIAADHVKCADFVAEEVESFRLVTDGMLLSPRDPMGGLRADPEIINHCGDVGENGRFTSFGDDAAFVWGRRV